MIFNIILQCGSKKEQYPRLKDEHDQDHPSPEEEGN